jgi:hypothetical protein
MPIKLMSYLMNRILARINSKETDALWQISLVLLLLCGIALYPETGPQRVAADTSSTSVAKFNQFALAANSDNLRVRPNGGENDPAPSDRDGLSFEIIPARLIEFEVRSFGVPEHNPLFAQIPRAAKYLLQVPRAPPLM